MSKYIFRSPIFLGSLGVGPIEKRGGKRNKKSQTVLQEGNRGWRRGQKSSQFGPLVEGYLLSSDLLDGEVPAY